MAIWEQAEGKKIELEIFAFDWLPYGILIVVDDVLTLRFASTAVTVPVFSTVCTQ